MKAGRALVFLAGAMKHFQSTKAIGEVGGFPVSLYRFDEKANLPRRKQVGLGSAFEDFRGLRGGQVFECARHDRDLVRAGYRRASAGGMSARHRRTEQERSPEGSARRTFGSTLSPHTPAASIHR